MDRLWTPWRFHYVSAQDKPAGCVFCAKPAEESDENSLILHRGSFNYVLLNLFPYSSGHLMVVPFEHVDTLSAASREAAAEMMELARHAEAVLRRAYNAPGVNLGMNLGACAGAGVAGHIHLHVLPRWPGDVNFMTAICETRVIPEDLKATWRKLKAAW